MYFSIVLTMILELLLPYKYLKENSLYRHLNKHFTFTRYAPKCIYISL